MAPFEEPLKVERKMISIFLPLLAPLSIWSLHSQRACKHRISLLSLLAGIALPLTSSAAAETYFERYGLLPGTPDIDLGTQPLGYPSGVITAVMQRDKILRKALDENKQALKSHPFRRGADMVKLLADQRLEAGLLGDMPTILAAVTSKVWIVGLVKQTFTAIVARELTQVSDLTGKRVAYAPGSSAHHSLLQGLASAGISEHQVTLVALEIDQMPDALEAGKIDAFAGWEPASTIALAKNKRNHILFRGLSSDYFVINQEFARRSPQAALKLVAGFVRAIQWMRHSQSNLNTATVWAMADTVAFSGKPAAVSVAQIAAITRREILDIPSAPTILSNPSAPPLRNEFLFLSKLGKLPADASAQQLESALSYGGLAQVMSDVEKFQIDRFDYQH